MFSKTRTIGLIGLNAFPVEVEVKIDKGMPAFTIIGSPDTVIKESRERIRATLKSLNITLPPKSILVSLAPASIKKSGSVLDLAIFVNILRCMNVFDADLENSAFIGELSLNGLVRPVNGVLPMVIKAKDEKLTSIYVPAENAYEASVVDGVDIYPVNNVTELLLHFQDRVRIEKQKPYEIRYQNFDSSDFADVKGQTTAKYALEIAAAGGHNVLMIGTPGSGKSMLAKRLPSILPKMSFQEAIETTNVYSICGLLDSSNPLIVQRPFRAPHNNMSTVGLVGGGESVKPGEISLAHNGVLFLDELPEYKKDTLEALRQPLEDRKITITRSSGSFTYPCSIVLIAAMNPCPCGYNGTPRCTCKKENVKKYLSKISGPMLDRFDMHIDIAPVEYAHIASKEKEESSENIRQRVEVAREIQQERFKGLNTHFNSQITDDKLHEFCVLDRHAENLIEQFFNSQGISGRAYSRILKVARTIADLAGYDVIRREHIMQATMFRSIDNKYWQ